MSPSSTSPASLALLLLVLAACQPALPDRPDRTGVGEGSEAFVEPSPAAPLDALPPVFRLRAAAPGVEAFLLFRGEMREGHVRQLERGEMSLALAERLVETLSWRAAVDGAGTGGHGGRLEAAAPG
jgi:hypothetical protein